MDTREPQMSNWMFTIRERMTANREGFRRFQKFAGFANSEIVTLDSMLCSEVITELRDEDWEHNIHEDSLFCFFRDPKYLMQRQPLDTSKHQIVALFQPADSLATCPADFELCGHDIMDSHFGNSTLTNCGPIPEAFTSTDTNEFGLIDEYDKAVQVRDKMRALQPNDPHLGKCEVWLIARMLLNNSS